MKMKIGFSVVLLATVAMAGVPRVSDVKFAQDGKHRAVVTYTLSEAPGIVTFDILTNGVSIGATVLTNAYGDVNKLVQPGSGRITWEPWCTWPGRKIASGVSARVTVWPTNAPPDWLAVDLTKSGCPVTYYASQEALPWGKIWQNTTYKGNVLLMRRIPASHVLSFMGSPETEAKRIAGRETRRMCTLTNDFYIGVYPMTRRHALLLIKGPESTETGLNPLVNQSYNMLRYHTNNTETLSGGLPPVNFPLTSRTFVGSSSYLKAWRGRTGLMLDLPTSAQWEFACRAGSDTPVYLHAYCDGSIAQVDNIASPLGSVVGQKGANNWYIFDMLGNTYEWVLDYFEENITADAVVDPLGATSDASFRRKIRGFHWSDKGYWRSAFFTGSAYLTQQDNIGFRLCVTLP